MHALKVSLLVPPYLELDYLLPKELDSSFFSPGDRVLVSLGSSNRKCCGLVTGLATVDKQDFSYKTILLPLEKKLLSKTSFQLLQDMSKRYLVSFPMVLGHVLPSWMKKKPSKVWIKHKPHNLDAVLSDKKLYLCFLEAWKQEQIDFVDHQDLLISLKQGISSLKTRGAKKQAVLNLLAQEEYSLMELKSLFGSGIRMTLDKLQKEGFIEFKTAPTPQPPKAASYTLSPEQEKIACEIQESLEKKEFSLHLIYGVTGSGKTHIYFHLIKQCLDQGRSAIFLLPEVALAWGMFQRVKQFFSYAHIYLYTGKSAELDKQKIFYKVKNNVSLVIGTRSSLFLPFLDPGLIIVDEEHVESYKQESGVYYQAKEIAYFLARQTGATLVLGSATPDLKTYYAGTKKQISLHSLKNRYGPSVLPEIVLEDLRTKKNEGLFSPRVWQELVKVVEAGEQVVILHNRRGYVPVLYCEACGEVLKCPHCDVSVTYHASCNKVICHYCGFNLNYPPLCAKCQSVCFKFYGEGTEKLEEFLNEKLPQTSILRLDRDVAGSKQRLKSVLTEFSLGKAQILIGTQMLGKGHDFPQVKLGIVLDGDLGLNFPDYRATERMFQLLVQLCGRVGRREKKGLVYIQTRNMSHDIWKFVLKSDYEGFYQYELQKRKLFFYPPFSNLALIRISFFKNWHKQDEFLARLKADCVRLKQNFSGQVLGPVPAAISYLQSRKRFQVLLKSSSWQEIKVFFLQLKKQLSLALKDRQARLQMVLDLDPVSML
ncbi:MAG: primosomal protein N' [Desulfonauticus sp.]|nr:primosomal protein N' [Desulfonauticus sp.]